jgi:hypothetical protein
MLQFYQEEDYENSLRISPFNSEPKIRHVPHNKVCIIFNYELISMFFFLARINSENSSFRKSDEVYQCK